MSNVTYYWYELNTNKKKIKKYEQTKIRIILKLKIYVNKIIKTKKRPNQTLPPSCIN